MFHESGGRGRVQGMHADKRGKSSGIWGFEVGGRDVGAFIFYKDKRNANSRVQKYARHLCWFIAYMPLIYVVVACLLLVLFLLRVSQV